MQDTLRNLVTRIYNEYNNFILSFLPDEVKCKTPDKVFNIFYNDRTNKKEHLPLFKIALIRLPSRCSIGYSKEIDTFAKDIIRYFEKPLKDI